MKSILSNTLAITFLSALLIGTSSVLAAPSSKNKTEDARAHGPASAVSASTFIPQAPHFSVYSDKNYGSNTPPDASDLTVGSNLITIISHY